MLWECPSEINLPLFPEGMTCVSVADDLCVSSNRQPIDNLSPEERDARTVFCMQLAARIRPRDLEEFFSAVGKV